jgi:hypothetical protein
VASVIVPDYKLHDAPLAMSFEVFRCESSAITIERVRQRDGPDKWAIRDGFRMCLSTEGVWDYESMPSNRPEDWIATHRFDDFEVAWAAAKETARLSLEDYLDRVKRANERRV